MKYDLKKRIFLVKKYYELNNPTLVQRAFRTEYDAKTVPNHKVIKNIVSNFGKKGSAATSYPKNRNSSGKREEVKKQVETIIEEFPNLSI